MQEIQPVNNVVMDKIIEDILIDYNNCPNDIFELIIEHLGAKYSLDDFTDYILDKDTLKKKFAMIFISQNYARSYIGKLVFNEQLEDLF